jgi:ATP-dependent DNA ligase
LFPKISPIIAVQRAAISLRAPTGHELKYDGFRALAYIDAARRRFVSRRGNEMKRFKELSMAKDLKGSDIGRRNRWMAQGSSL